MAGFRWFQVISGSFWVVPAGFRWFQMVSSGFRWFQVVPRFSKYRFHMQKRKCFYLFPERLSNYFY